MALTGCRSLRLSDLSVKSTSGQSERNRIPFSQHPVYLGSICERLLSKIALAGFSRSGHRHPGLFVSRGRCLCKCLLRARLRVHDGLISSGNTRAARTVRRRDGSMILFVTPDRSGRGRPLLIPSTNNTHEPSPKDRTNERCDKAS